MKERKEVYDDLTELCFVMPTCGMLTKMIYFSLAVNLAAMHVAFERT
jgi:hypothetical protein